MYPSNLTGRYGIFNEKSSIPEGHHLGDKKEFSDGRVFRLAKNGGTALTSGKLVVQGDPVANHLALTPTAAAIGDTTLTVTLGATAATANQYADGFAVDITTGMQYKIKSHPAADASATLKLELYDALLEAIPATDDIDLVANPYSGVVVSAKDQADLAVGVPPIDVTASYYFWLQTAGLAAVLCDEAITRGKAVTTGTGVAGAVEMLDAAGEAQVGIMHEAGVDTKYKLVDLTLE